MKHIKAIDLHMHTTVSDGTDSPAEIVSCVKEAGISLFSVTDHDAIKGCETILSAREEGDPLFITGVEFSCRDERGRYHILGYGYDPSSPAIRDVVEEGHGYRMEKFEGRLKFLESEFGIVFPDEDLDWLYRQDNPGKPHLGNLIAKAGYAPDKDSAIRDYINKARFPVKYVRPGEAISGIIAAGGIPVLAHPPFGSGEERLSRGEMKERLSYLADMGLSGIEAFYSGFSDDMISEMLDFADSFGFLVTAGSDYHGANKPVRLGNTGLDRYIARESEMPAGLLAFLERVGAGN